MASVPIYAFLGVLFSSPPNTILSKPTAAFQHKCLRNKTAMKYT